MNVTAKPGVVIFAGDPARLARFYEAMTGMIVRVADDKHTVMESEAFQLVLHAISGEPATKSPPIPREDGCIKLFFPVANIAQAREKAAALGGRLWAKSEEWEARGFRACDGMDPEGNVIQVREDTTE